MIYVHIPFCRSKCHYCDFLSFDKSTEKKCVDSYVNALFKELDEVSISQGQESVFFGGGTPTILPAETLCRLLERLKPFLAKDAEITLEANPNTIERSGLSMLRKGGFNRLSMGLQAAEDDNLALLGRTHRLADFDCAYNDAVAAGFENINTDLIYGLPSPREKAMRDFKHSLSYVVSLKPKHISAYCLSIEQGTHFHRLWHEGKLVEDEDAQLEQYNYAVDYLTDNGFKHYEISNFANAGYECRHNIGYWTRLQYLGLGLGAHSLIGNRRFSNTRIFDEYCTNRANSIAYEPVLTLEDCIEETIFLGLRLIDGIDCDAFEAQFGIDRARALLRSAQKLDDFLTITKAPFRLKLTRKGLNVYNAVVRELIFALKILTEY